MEDSIRDRIAKAWLKMAMSGDVDKIKVSDLTAACGISRPIFYYYFMDIFSIPEYLSEQMLQNAVGNLPEGTKIDAGLSDFLTQYFIQVPIHEKLTSSKYREHYAEASISCLRSMLRELIRVEGIVYTASSREFDGIIEFFANGIAGVTFHRRRMSKEELSLLSFQVAWMLRQRLLNYPAS